MSMAAGQAFLPCLRGLAIGQDAEDLAMRHIALVALAAVLLSSPGVAFAQADPEGFLEACNTSDDLLEQTQNDPEGLERLCTCVGDDFSANLSQTDIDLLADDLAGVASDAEKMAYETYEDLSAYASETLGNCLVIEGFADGYDPSAQ
jgi:hypothetical protein